MGTTSSTSLSALTAPLAASPASFQPSKATTSSRPPRNRSLSVTSLALARAPPGCSLRRGLHNRTQLDWPVVTAPTESPSAPAAVLWDMDGAIVDTETYWMRAETELVESFG